MRGNENVINELNAALRAELIAIVQYMVHAEMCHNWGYQRMGDYIRKQAIDEMRHAEHLIERILFLDGTPQVGIGLDPKIGDTVKAQLENDLAAELEAVQQYNHSVQVCRDAGDNGSRELFEAMVKDEEEHTDFLEAQRDLIAQTGYENYLAQQIKGG
ncbi:MAG: bacterioferritin [Bryobacteraceae bacterium]|nr:bacterioferritin [Bryobacteraceae bacterium]HEU0140478.1 bacterioferritin [Bryobacteraceae bacterium]